MSAAPSYFTFKSSDVDVARVSENGVISIVGEGTAEITAVLAGVRAQGSLTINSLGEFVPAPTPTRNSANVISVFSDAYTNILVDFYNGFFAPFQTTLGGAVNVGGENILRYTQLNFVATEFKMCFGFIWIIDIHKKQNDFSTFCITNTWWFKFSCPCRL